MTPRQTGNWIQTFTHCRGVISAERNPQLHLKILWCPEMFDTDHSLRSGQEVSPFRRRICIISSISGSEYISQISLGTSDTIDSLPSFLPSFIHSFPM
jgi:hypothetical protein